MSPGSRERVKSCFKVGPDFCRALHRYRKSAHRACIYTKVEQISFGISPSSTNLLLSVQGWGVGKDTYLRTSLLWLQSRSYRPSSLRITTNTRFTASFFFPSLSLSLSLSQSLYIHVMQQCCIVVELRNTGVCELAQRFRCEILAAPNLHAPACYHLPADSRWGEEYGCE